MSSNNIRTLLPQNDNSCVGLATLDAAGPTPWSPRVLAGVTNMTARIGPAGGRRGYTPITGENVHTLDDITITKHVARYKV